jgi:hypothetical protein
MGSQHREYPPWLLDLPIGWFLGMWPLPSVGHKSHEELASWLDQLRPFQRLLVYDEKLGRCKRPTEAEPLPALTSFRERGLPVPKAPLPGWKGAVPPRYSEPAMIFLHTRDPGVNYRPVYSPVEEE